MRYRLTIEMIGADWLDGAVHVRTIDGHDVGLRLGHYEVINDGDQVQEYRLASPGQRLVIRVAPGTTLLLVPTPETGKEWREHASRVAQANR